MRRFSIARLMLLVALVAANLGILRFLLSPSWGGRSWHYQLPAGFLPLFDAVLLAVHLLLRRNRTAAGARALDSRRFALPFIATVALFLGAVLLSFFFAYEALPAVLRAVESVFESLGLKVDMDTPADRYLVGPIFLAVTLSAAPLALAVATLWSRFGPIAPPKEGPC